jgi:hypothetical protein
MSDHIESGVPRTHRRLALGVLLCGALATACADRDPAAPTDPTPFHSSTTNQISVSSTATTVIAQPVSSFFCPTVSPFLVPMTVIVNPNGRSAVVITQIQLQFTDSTQRTQPTITLPGPVPITQYGDALAASRDALTFPLSLGIGCGVGTIGTVVVVVNGHDGNGLPVTGRVSFNVRH